VIAGQISGATRNFGAPEGWSEETHIPCETLAVCDLTDDFGHPVMVSSWKPTSEELALLNNGAEIHLNIWGIAHPPVALMVAA
jgi:hypothetical protein